MTESLPGWQNRLLAMVHASEATSVKRAERPSPSFCVRVNGPSAAPTGSASSRTSPRLRSSTISLLVSGRRARSASHSASTASCSRA